MTKKLLRPSIENDVDAIGLLEDRQGKCWKRRSLKTVR
jgi:hypothetical protein